MFDFDATKLMIVGVLALIVLGPEELPRVMRQLGNALGKMRRMAGEFQGQFMDAMREAELDDIRKEVSKLGDTARDAVKVDHLDPAAELRKAAEGAPSTPAVAPTPEQIAAQDAETFGPLDITPSEPFRPVTSETLAAQFEAQESAQESAHNAERGTDAASAAAIDHASAAPAPSPAPPAAPQAQPAASARAGSAKEAFYRGAANGAPTAGQAVEPDGEITFRRPPADAAPAAGADTQIDGAPRRRSARPKAG
jgi:sec-independent protein translocase protein TatB